MALIRLQFHFCVQLELVHRTCLPGFPTFTKIHQLSTINDNYNNNKWRPSSSTINNNWSYPEGIIILHKKVEHQQHTSGVRIALESELPFIHRTSVYNLSSTINHHHNNNNRNFECFGLLNVRITLETRPIQDKVCVGSGFFGFEWWL